jgi:ADP-ribose pyrophosphatase YjhB (NUDIX family)
VEQRLEEAMKYCSQCGSTLGLAVPQGDNRPRHLCNGCGHIHYQNPKIVTGVIPEWGERLLLCRRAIEPRYGLWTLPAGFMENGESADEGAAREALEEANARIRIDSLYTLFNLPHIDQVYMLYRGTLLDLDFSAGDESLEVKLFREADIPWEELAFQVVRETLKLYFHDRRQQRFGVHSGSIMPLDGDRRDYRVQLLGA